MRTLNAVLKICWIGVMLVSSPCIAKSYQWVDENGIKNFTDDPSAIPHNAQSQAMTDKESENDPPLKTLFPALDIRKMLGDRNFEKLNMALADYYKAYTRDVRHEEALYNAFGSFSVNDENYEPLLNEWVKSHPGSYQPYLARAFYFYNFGWKGRGGKWESETTDAQREGMRYYFSQAKKDLEQVLQIKPNHIVSYYLLINMYKATGGQYEIREIAKKALKENPDSFSIRSSYLLSLTPRWGGTYTKMDQFATEAQKYVPKNPKLKVLQGYTFYDAGSMHRNAKNYGVALQYLDKALSFGDLAMFYEERAEIYYRMDKNDEALKDIGRAIAMAPQNADFYLLRSKILGSKKMMQAALKDIEIADQLNPNDEYIAKQKKWLADSFIYSGYAQQKSKNLSGAVMDFNAAIQINPGNADAYYRRARAFIDQKDLASATNDLNKAIELGPNNFDFYLLMDWLLTQKSDWSGIINHWNRFITLNPDSDRAYLERGGAFFRKGDLPSAVADAKKAADLGNAEGQRIVDRYKGQMGR